MKIRFLFSLLLLSFSGFAQVSLPALVSNNMVLQQKADVNIWGWANPGERV
ncbi:MAG: sialate O-acetylesterase, partial [Runella slithyformis]